MGEELKGPLPQRSRRQIEEEEEDTREKILKKLASQLGGNLEECLPSYRPGSEEERHQKAVTLVEEFLKLGGPPNAVDKNYWPILTIAVVQSCAPLVKLLLDKGADVNFKNWIHYGVPDQLYASVMSGGKNMKILDMILRAGAELNGRFTHGTAED